MKKQLLVGASSLLCVVLASCGVRQGGNNENGGSHIGELSDTKTNITIGTYDGGVKAKWLENAKPIFEDLFKDAKNFISKESLTASSIYNSARKQGFLMEEKSKEILFPNLARLFSSLLIFLPI